MSQSSQKITLRILWWYQILIKSMTQYLYRAKSINWAAQTQRRQSSQKAEDPNLSAILLFWRNRKSMPRTRKREAKADRNVSRNRKKLVQLSSRRAGPLAVQVMMVTHAITRRTKGSSTSRRPSNCQTWKATSCPPPSSVPATIFPTVKAQCRLEHSTNSTIKSSTIRLSSNSSTRTSFSCAPKASTRRPSPWCT